MKSAGDFDVIVGFPEKCALVPSMAESQIGQSLSTTQDH